MTISPAILKIYATHGRQLIPISPKDPHKLKRPLHAQWTTRDYSHEEIQEYAQNEYNLGWRLTPGDVVIDIDPRNGGTDGMATLLADFQKYDPTIEDLGDVFPMVKTGGGGYHLYGSIDPDIKLQNTIQKYGPGVEFKSVGRQVIIPGSVHPSGKPYTFDDFSDYANPAPPLPDWLVMAVRRDVSSALPTTHLTGDAELTPQQLHKLLQHVPATDYADNDSWMSLMAACHEATKGAGLDVFLSWSLSDPSYIGHDHIIRHRWQSLEPGKTGNITAHTLYQAVASYGGDLPPMTLASAGVSPETFTALPPASPVPPMANVIHHTDRGQLDKDVAALTNASTVDDIKAVLLQVAGVDQMDQETYLTVIRQQTGRPTPALRKGLQAARVKRFIDANDTTIDDAGIDVTTLLLKRKFSDGETLLHGSDETFWHYNGTHWVTLADNIIDQYLLKSANLYKLNNPHIKVGVSSLMAQARHVLRARQARPANLHIPDKSKCVINTRNCEVWFNPDTGLVTPKPHNPESWLTTILDCDFNPHAKCLTFDRALADMFVNQPDGVDIIRHLWEIIGYIIQPIKNIATWVLFHGKGANGKTVVLNVLSRLLGDAVLHKSINDMDLSRNNHALADLPGKLCVVDEDLSARTLLPDETLKKVSESKELTANPKGKALFKFTNQAIVVFASNEYPKTKDLSSGLRRRAMVIDFSRSFSVAEQDYNLAQRIIDTEMDGVLIQALKGLGRLRQRGGWQLPTSCQTSFQLWQGQSNTISEFVRDVMVPAAYNSIEFAKVYGVYRMWCLDNGYKHYSTKIGFGRGLEALGVVKGRGASNKMFIRGYEIGNLDFEVI